MDPVVVYYGAAVLLILVNAFAWLTTFFALPGPWFMLAFTAGFAYFVPPVVHGGVSWRTVGILAALAVVGELIEFGAGAAGAAKGGASRRATVLALVGTVVGSTAGAILGIPIPIVGSLIAAVAGGAGGAFAGAYVGELWAGKEAPERLAVSRGALVGRLLGTLGKLATSTIMFVVATIDLFW